MEPRPPSICSHYPWNPISFSLSASVSLALLLARSHFHSHSRDLFCVEAQFNTRAHTHTQKTHTAPDMILRGTNKCVRLGSFMYQDYITSTVQWSPAPSARAGVMFTLLHVFWGCSLHGWFYFRPFSETLYSMTTLTSGIFTLSWKWKNVVSGMTSMWK